MYLHRAFGLQGTIRLASVSAWPWKMGKGCRVKPPQMPFTSQPHGNKSAKRLSPKMKNKANVIQGLKFLKAPAVSWLHGSSQLPTLVQNMVSTQDLKNKYELFPQIARYEMRRRLSACRDWNYGEMSEYEICSIPKHRYICIIFFWNLPSTRFSECWQPWPLLAIFRSGACRWTIWKPLLDAKKSHGQGFRHVWSTSKKNHKESMTRLVWGEFETSIYHFTILHWDIVLFIGPLLQ